MINEPQKTRRYSKITLFKALKDKKWLFASGFLKKNTRNLNGNLIQRVYKKIISNKSLGTIILVIVFLFGLAITSVVESNNSVFKKIDTLKVIPGSVKAVNWKKPEAALLQDVSESGVYQSFSSDNSAMFDGREFVEQIITPEPQNILDNSPEQVEISPENEIEVEQPENTEADIPHTESETPEEIAEPDETSGVEPENETPVEPELTPEPEAVETPLEALSKSFFKFVDRATTILPFAQVSIVETVEVPEVQNPEDSSTEETVTPDEQEVVEEIVAEEQIQNPEETLTEEESASENEEDNTVQNPEEDISPVTEIEETITPSPTGEGFESEQLDGQDDNQVVESGERLDNEIVFTDFSLPPLNSGQFIRNMQLRLSLGGSVALTESDPMPSLDIEYFIDNEWRSAGVVLLDGEASNALNGGYYLFALPRIKQIEGLDDFSVRVSYVGDSNVVKKIYVDSLWLEIDTETFDRNLLEERIKAKQLWHLKKPEVFDLVTADADFTRIENPKFSLKYESQRNFAVRMFRNLIGKDLAALKSIKFQNVNTGPVNIEPQIDVTKDGLISIQLTDEDRLKLRPGEYEVEVTVSEGGKEFDDTFNFQWGMLAVNPNQTEYQLGETAEISLGALTRNGNTLCDADLQFYIIDPTDYFHEAEVAKSGLCNGNNVIDVPDYSASFVPEVEGVYEMYVERIDENGNVLSHTSDTFEVVSNHDISLKRNGPTRIFPPAPYPMEITLTSSTSWNGVLTERVPKTFSVFDTDARVTEVGDAFELSWDVRLNRNQPQTFSYRFDAPDLSPYLYTLGPARLDSSKVEKRMVEEISSTGTTTENSNGRVKQTDYQFVEHRNWQIASDATGNAILFWDDGSSIPSGWTCLSCGSGTFYQKFVRGGPVYNVVGGASTSTHNASGTVYAASDSQGENKPDASDIAAGSHLHTLTPIIGVTTTVPEYRQLRVIQYTDAAGEPLTVPAGAIGIFDIASSSLPSGWTRYADQDGRYIYAEDTPGTTGGSNVHSHSVTGTTGNPTSAGVKRKNKKLTSADQVHTHTISTTTGLVNNEPSYIEVLLAKLGTASSTPNDLIMLWTDTPPTGWLPISNSSGDVFYKKFIKPATTYGATGGQDSHSHDDITGIVSSGPSATDDVNDKAESGAESDTHTHNVDVTNFTTTLHLPPYIEAIFAKRLGDNPSYRQVGYRWYVNEDNQTPTDFWPEGGVNLEENEPISSTSTPLHSGDVIRLRVNAEVTVSTSTTGSRFKLQYASSTSCSAASGWTDVGSATSSVIWRGYNNGSITDHGSLSSTTLASTTIAETYEENGYSTSTPNEIGIGEVGEWDWVLQQNDAEANTTYCFRMVRNDGTPFTSYTNYPQLLTDSAPNPPALEKLFDNEKTASTTPWFEFLSIDPEGDDLSYQIQIDSDYLFEPAVIDKNTEDHASQFTNLVTTSDKDPYNSGELMRFVSETPLTNGVTYYWRVRAKDPDGSNQWGEWSTIRSFTIDTALTVSAWFQTTEEQFDTDALTDLDALASDQVQILGAAATGTIISTAVDFDDGSIGNAWDEFSFNDTETAGDIKYQIEYLDEIGAWSLIPDTVLSGNSTGFDTSPVSLLDLPTDIYNKIRIVGDFTDGASSPSLEDWTIEWGYRVETPSISALFANEKTGTTTPTFEFTTTDPQGDDLTYQVSWSTSYDFSASTTRVSNVDVGFLNIDDVGDTDTFTSGDSIQFTIQGGDTLTNNTTYWWRVRATDRLADGSFSLWTTPRSFTVATDTVVSTWFQTTDEQFDTNILSGLTTPDTGSLQVATSAVEALLAYGEGTASVPRYRQWDGSDWSAEAEALDVDATIRWVVTEASPVREEYIMGTLGSDGDVNVQVFAEGSWGDLQEITSSFNIANKKGFDIVYETNSGDAMVVACDGDADPTYYTWDGDSWNVGSSINLDTTENCNWIELAANPVSDELILLTRNNLGDQYEALVWNATTSSWGNSLVLGESDQVELPAMAVIYEESGGQGMIITGDGGGKNFRYSTWNGSSWATAADTPAISEKPGWAYMARDEGTDRIVACYFDKKDAAGALVWSGSAWGNHQEFDEKAKPETDRAVACVFENTTGRDGYVLSTYRSESAGVIYRDWDTTSWGTEAQVNTIDDSATMQLSRTGDGTILGVFLDDATDALLATEWDGSSWSTTDTLENDVSVDSAPYGHPYMIAPRNPGTNGTVIVSPGIYFTDGLGPYWKEMSWVDSTPGSSEILYHIQYSSDNGETWSFIPDEDLSGNISGATTSPIDLSGLNQNTYNLIRPYAALSCDGGNNCPILYDWTVEWAEGILVSGTLQEFDQITDVTSGTIAVAVNGVLQVGKTGVVSGGSWSISNVTVFPGDIVTVFVSGATDDVEAVGVTRYDGVGDIGGLQMYERHLTLGSNDATSTPLTNSELGTYDKDDDEDVFIDLTGTTLTVCGDVGCGQNEIYINASTTYRLEGTLNTHDFENNGIVELGGDSVFVDGSWDNNATVTAATSTVTFSATTTSETIDSTSAVVSVFNNVTFGDAASTADWSLITGLDVDGNFAVNEGTLVRGTTSITVAGNLSTGANGTWSGVGTTTFDGTGTSNWSDAHVNSENVGHVVIDGVSKTIQLSGNVGAQSITIGSDDILDASASDHNITVYEGWINNNTFVPQEGTVFFGATTTSHIITAGGDPFHNLAFVGVGGAWSFTEANLSVNNNFTVSTGTVTMPTGTTTLAGSFSSVGGTFAHNNAGVYMTSSGVETIAAGGTSFTNAFYNLTFNGSGSWTFTDTHATTSNDLRIQSGAVTFPSGELSVGGSLVETGGGFNHGNGTVKFNSTAQGNLVDPDNSSFNNLTFNGLGGGWRLPAGDDVTVLGDFTVTSGIATSTSGTLFVGGSWLVSDTFVANGGTVEFDSTDLGEIIDSGGSHFYNLVFDGVTGGWIFNADATSTNNLILTNVGSFTNAQTIEVQGEFYTDVASTSTDWSGGTLYLNSGTDYEINTKSSDGDDYDTLEIGVNTDISMWNSTSSAYVVDVSGSLYSQDHNTADGYLNIFGDYTRTSGTEYWSYETDFDGTDISGTPRQANVFIENSSVVNITGAIFEGVGTSTSSTTIQNRGSGTYTINISAGTTTLQYYDFSDLGSSGLSLLNGNAVTNFSDGSFTPGVASGAGLTLSSTTIDANPALQVYRVNFSTTTPISAYNVAQTDGTPVSYWWFRDSSGNIDGEAFDNDTDDPGSVRWDDSSLTINISGVVYSDDGVTPMGTSTCDGTTQNVKVRVENGSTFTGFCNSGDGAYTVSGVAVIGDPVLVIYLDTDGGDKGTVITQTPTADIADLDIYQNRVMTRHEDVTPLTIADMAVWDSAIDSDIQFEAATGTTDSLIVYAGNELHIASSTTFAPGGDVTIRGNASSSPQDGSLHIDNNATFTGSATSTYTIAGSFTMDEGAVFTAASTSVVMNATTTGKTITTPDPQVVTFNELTFQGDGGGWNLNGDIVAIENITVASGTVTGTADIAVQNGSMNGNGTVSFGAGTTTIESTNTLGGTTPWTFGNLVLGNGAVTGTTTPGGATTTILDTLTIETGHFLDAGSTVWNLAGTGDVFVENGTFQEDTSTVRYSGTGSANILSTNYYNLEVMAPASPSIYTATGLGVVVENDLSVGGATTTTLTFNIDHPALDVNDDVRIGGTGILEASDTAQFTVSGDWDNNGTFIGNGGTVTFDSAGTSDIAAGSSSFSNATINGSGTFTVSESATSTDTFTISNATTFTLAQNQSLAVGGTFTNAVGGAATTWSTSTLYLYGGGNYEINATTTNDIYSTLKVAADTQIRMWNSSAETYAIDSAGSLYSQDHAQNNGDLYIYGAYQKVADEDYWSYTTDFDGTDISGSPRIVDVYIEDGGSVLYTGGEFALLGTPTASSTIQNQGSGTYSFRIGGSASSTMNHYEFRDLDNNGLTFSATPTINDISYGYFEVGANTGSAITVGGTVITQNPAAIYSGNTFATSSGVTTAVNVTATGTTLSAWRFTGHTGDIDGENFDNDDGDPGVITWDDSTLAITISGTVYSDEGTATSTVCDGSTSSIRLVGVGFSPTTTPCSGSTGTYSFGGITYATGTTLTVYIDGETENGVTVTQDPISNINNLDIYENRVIIRHEGTEPLTIDDMTGWDSSDDPADIIFTAVSGSPDTLTLPANTKLIVWGDKEFAPGGNVTVSGGGAGAAYDGTLEIFNDGTFTSQPGESHSIGGSLITGSGSTFDADTSTFTFTTTGSGRTIDTNDTGFHDLTLNGSGSWTVTDTNLTVGSDLTITQGSVTLPAATTTVGGSLLVSDGSFDANSGIIAFTSTASENIKPGGSDFNEFIISGSGSFTTIGDNATVTESVVIQDGTFTSATGTLAIGANFINDSIFTHGSGILRFTSNSNATVTASSSDLFTTEFVGSGTYRFTDDDVALLGDILINSGFVNLASGTMSVGGSFLNNGGSFDNASGTILFNSGDVGETINPGSSPFHNVSFSNADGGWTITNHATTTGNFALLSTNDFTLDSGISLYVGGVFTNLVGGLATDWTGSTLTIESGVGYTINTKSAGGDAYNNIRVGSSTALSMWESSGNITMIDASSSLYSQDHAEADGSLYIYGNYARTTGADYWSYATDFDGTSLSGSERQVYVYYAENASSTYAGGALNVVGASGTSTIISNQGSGTYAIRILGGTLNAQYYSLANMNADGLYLSGTTTVTSLLAGDYTLGIGGGSLITVSSTTLNYNTGLVISNATFATTTLITGNNVTVIGSTTAAWTFTGHSGNLSGESFDNDEDFSACGSVRWDDSTCLLTLQAGFRFRNDDGGEGVPNSEWFDTDWDKRKRVTLTNQDAVSYTDAAIKLDVTYDSDMQADFDDLRFTSSNGTTQIDHFIETYTASTDAVVWVKVPLLATSTDTEIYMYYDNGASIDGSATTTFSMIDEFEDNSLGEYSGDTGEFTIDNTAAYERTYRLEASDPDNGKTGSGGMYNNGYTVSRGEKIRFLQYIDTSTGSGDEVCTLFATQSQTQNYAVCLELYGTDRMSLVEDALYNDSSGTVLASTTVTYSTGWYEIEIDWDTDSSIFVTLSQNGSIVATTTATDSTYTSGGIGYALWFYHGAWDTYSSRPLLENEPSVSFGFEQVSGGASWIAPLNNSATGVEIDDSLRVRFLIENTGLAVIDQNYEIEFAAKGASPSCEAVSYGDYVEVPNQSACGTNALCMQASTYFSNLASTTDLLGGNGTFTQGQIVEDPGNNSGNITIDQSEYTEVEYTITATTNVTDSNYCLRITNEGTELDSYPQVAELEMLFTPNITSLSLNGGIDIALTGGATTTITATGTVSDLNGYTDILAASTTIFRSGVGASCTADNNNCYTAGNSMCSFYNCAGTSCDVTCSVDAYYHADPTDIGTYAGETWRAQLEVRDVAGSVATATAPSVDLLTLRALSVDNSINYGALTVDSDTGGYNATTTVENIGNDAIDVSIEGTDLTDGGSSAIPVSKQIFATSTFSYSACTFCSSLATTSSNYELDLAKPSTTTPPVSDQLFWGIAIPFGVAGTAHQGTNIFYAISD